jgi:hypothetical protein
VAHKRNDPKVLFEKREFVSDSTRYLDPGVISAQVKVYPVTTTNQAIGHRSTIEAELNLSDGDDHFTRNFGIADYDAEDETDPAELTKIEEVELANVHRIRDMIVEFTAAYEQALAYRRRGNFTC